MALCNLIRHETPLEKYYQVNDNFYIIEPIWACNVHSIRIKLFIFQNFDRIPHVPPNEEIYYGGSVSLADHCPYIQEFAWRSKNVVVRGSQCQFEDNTPSLYSLIVAQVHMMKINIFVFL